MTPGEQIAVGILVLVVGGLLLAGARKLIDFISDAIATKLINSINGQLGLAELRNDVTELKRQFEQILIDLN